jgi:hypothetical protein
MMWCLKYIRAKNIYITMEIYSRNDWNDFDYLWNLYYLLNIVIPYDWNKFVSHVKSLISIISQMGFFFRQWPWICSKLNFWQTIIFKWKMIINMKWAIFKNSIWNLFWLINSNWKLMLFKTKNMIYYIAYTINIAIIPWI